MENSLDNVVRDVEEVEAELRAGNDVLVPLHLLQRIHFRQKDNLVSWPQFETCMATVPHKGKDILYILLKPIRMKIKFFYREIPVSDIGE